VLGLVYGWVRRPVRREADEYGWVVLWLLAFLAASLSAFGQGWFLRFGPHRLQVLLWLPICMLSAVGLARLRERMPRVAGVLRGGLVVCGVSSVVVCVCFFQAPLGRQDARGPYPSFHSEVMSLSDAHVTAALGPGRVLAIPPASDAIVYTRGNQVVYGIGSFNLADQPYVALRAEVDGFFGGDTTEEERLRVVREWCADYVYCSDTWPTATEVVDQLRATPWLEEVAGEGRATLFRVALPPGL